MDTGRKRVETWPALGITHRRHLRRTPSSKSKYHIVALNEFAAWTQSLTGGARITLTLVRLRGRSKLFLADSGMRHGRVARGAPPHSMRGIADITEVQRFSNDEIGDLHTRISARSRVSEENGPPSRVEGRPFCYDGRGDPRYFDRFARCLNHVLRSPGRDDGAVRQTDLTVRKPRATTGSASPTSANPNIRTAANPPQTPAYTERYSPSPT